MPSFSFYSQASDISETHCLVPAVVHVRLQAISSLLVFRLEFYTHLVFLMRAICPFHHIPLVCLRTVVFIVYCLLSERNRLWSVLTSRNSLKELRFRTDPCRGWVTCVTAEQSTQCMWGYYLSKNAIKILLTERWRDTRFIMVIFQILTAAVVKVKVVWNVAPCSLLEIYRRFSRSYCRHPQGGLSVLRIVQTKQTLWSKVSSHWILTYVVQVCGKVERFCDLFEGNLQKSQWGRLTIPYWLCAGAYVFVDLLRGRS
jgi:hypothetical protein